MKHNTNLAMKVWSMLLAVFAFSTNAKADNVLSIEDFYIVPGEEKTISVMLDNSDPISSLQFDVTLPNGIEFVEKSTKMNKTRLNNHSLFASDYEGHKRFTIFTEAEDIKESAFVGNSGEIFTFKVKATMDFKGGIMHVTTIEGCDATVAIPIEHDMEPFDVNAYMFAGTFSLSSEAVNMVVNDVEPTSVDISVANTTGLTGLQLYIELPENLVVESIETGERVPDNYKPYPSKLDASGAVVLSSLIVESFEGDDGTVLTLNLKAVGDVNGKLIVKNLVTTNTSTAFHFEGEQAMDVVARPYFANIEGVNLSVADGQVIEEDSTFKISFSCKAEVIPENVASKAYGTVTYVVTPEGGEAVEGTADFDIANETNVLSIPNLAYSTSYTVAVKSVSVSYKGADAEEPVLINEVAVEDVAVSFTTNAEPIVGTISDIALSLADGQEIEDGTFMVSFSCKAVVTPENIASVAYGTVTYVVTPEGGEAVESTVDFNLADESVELLIPVAYSTSYTVAVKSVSVSYKDAESEEPVLINEVAVEDVAVSFTTNAEPVVGTISDIALSLADGQEIEDGMFMVSFSCKAVVTPENIASVAYGTLTYTVTPEGGDAVESTVDFNLADEVVDVLIPNLDYNTHYTVAVKSVSVSYKDAETGETVLINEVVAEDVAVSFTTNIDAINGVHAETMKDGKYVENGKVVIIKNGAKFNVAGYRMK